MERYKNRSGDSGVVAYESSPGRIVLRFGGGWKYEYTDASAGPEKIRKMQGFAAAGRGLSTYVSTVVRDAYARKFR